MAADQAGKLDLKGFEQLRNTDGRRQAVIEALHRLEAKGLVYYSKGKWFLTPLGLQAEVPPPPTEDEPAW